MYDFLGQLIVILITSSWL